MHICCSCSIEAATLWKCEADCNAIFNEQQCSFQQCELCSLASVTSVASVASVECGLYQYLLVTIGCPGLLLITTFDCTHSHSIITLILVGIIVIIIHILSGIFACCLLEYCFISFWIPGILCTVHIFFLWSINFNSIDSKGKHMLMICDDDNAMIWRQNNDDETKKTMMMTSLMAVSCKMRVWEDGAWPLPLLPTSLILCLALLCVALLKFALHCS